MTECGTAVACLKVTAPKSCAHKMYAVCRHIYDGDELVVNKTPLYKEPFTPQ